LPFPLEPLLPLDPLPLDPLLPLELLVLLPAPLDVDPVLVVPPPVELVPVGPPLVDVELVLDEELVDEFVGPPEVLVLLVLVELVELLPDPVEPPDDEVSAISVACRCNSLWSALPTETVANAMRRRIAPAAAHIRLPMQRSYRARTSLPPWLQHGANVTLPP